ncbi:MAG: hypothetical protein ACRD3J_28245, partial [Thermoanaerobaculia bacterium]
MIEGSIPTTAPARCATGTTSNVPLPGTKIVAPIVISKINFIAKPIAQSATIQLRRDSIVRSSANSAESMPESPRYVATLGAN